VSRRPRKRLDARGAVAIEYALLLPAFLLLTLGGMDAGRVMWTQITLDRAVQAAARCAVVDEDTCGNAADIRAYAAAQAWGMTVPVSAFTYESRACGAYVSATVDFGFVIPFISQRDVQLASSACYPVSP
jgi:Flp pilus assembly protein TadG